MKWYKHISDSGEDPDIMDSIHFFGADGYYVFFRTLEIMSREFDVNNPGVTKFSIKTLRKKYQISLKKVLKILAFFQGKSRIFCELFIEETAHGKIPMILIKCPKLKDLCDEFTSKTIKKNRDSIGSESGVNRDVEIRRRNKKKNNKERIKKESDLPLEPPEDQKKKKILYGTFVKLTVEEHERLVKEWGQSKVEFAIMKLDNSINSGKKYLDHNLTLQNWHRMGWLDGNGNKQTIGTDEVDWGIVDKLNKSVKRG